MVSPSIDGTVTGTFGFGNSSKSVSLTTTQAGLVVVFVSTGDHNNNINQSYVTSISDTAGLAWKKRFGTTGFCTGNGIYHGEVWWAVSPGALTGDSISIGVSNAVDGGAVVAFGVQDCKGWDNHLNLPQTTLNTATAGAYDTTGGDDLVLVFQFENGGTGNAPTGGGGGPSTFTSVAGARDGSGFAFCEAQVFSADAGGTPVSGGTLTSNSSYNHIIDVLTNDTQTPFQAPFVEDSNRQVLGNGATSGSLPITLSGDGEIVVIVNTNRNGGSNTATVASVTASGLTFAQRGSANEAGTGGGAFLNCETWAAPVTGGFAGAIALSLNAAVDGGQWGVVGIVGVDNVGPFDPDGSLPSFENTSDDVVLSTTSVHPLVLWVSNAASLGPSTRPAGFTDCATLSYNGGFGQDALTFAFKRYDSALSTTTLAAASGGTHVVNMADAFDPPASGSTYNVSQTDTATLSDDVGADGLSSEANTNFDYSANGKTVTANSAIGNGNWNSTRSTTAHKTGLKYLEVTVIQAHNSGGGQWSGAGIGILNGSESLTASFPGASDSNGFMCDLGNANNDFWFNGSKSTGFGGSVTVPGNTIALAIDLDNERVWFRDITRDGGGTHWWGANNNGSDDPTSPSTGFHVPGIASGVDLFYSLPMAYQGEVGAALPALSVQANSLDIVGTMPSGYDPWDMVPAGNTYSDSVTEAGSLSDDEDGVPLDGVSESAPLTDHPSATGTFHVSSSDTVTLADSEQRDSTHTGLIGERVDTTDAADGVVGHEGGVFEVANMVDFPNAPRGTYAVDVAEAASLQDFPDSGNFRLSVDEAMTPVDGPSSTLTTALSVVEAAPLADADSTPTPYDVSVAESSPLLDDPASPFHRSPADRAVTVIN